MHSNCANQTSLERMLREKGNLLPVCWVTETGSTSDDVKQLIKKTETDVRTVLIADRQTAGRGTRGRQWSAPEVAVLMTVAVPLKKNQEVPGLTLAIGEACVTALSGFNSFVKLKWPNDIWIHKGKAAGILCELIRNRQHRMHAVVGIGVNICLGQTGLKQTDVAAAALFKILPDAEAPDVLRVRVAAALSVAIERCCERFGSETLAGLQKRWPKLDALAGQKAILTLPTGRQIEGFSAGIGLQGELLFADASGQITAYADARIRPLMT